MATNPLVEERARNKREFLDILKKNPKTPLKKLIAVFANKTGLRSQVIQGYYRDFVDANLVKERDYEGLDSE